MTTEALILAGDGYSLAIAPDAETEKATLLEHSALIVEVSNQTDSDAARNQVRKLAAMRNAVEKSRKTVKEPVLQIGRDIDAKAKDFLADLEMEEKRLAGLIADHAAKVEAERQRIVREMEAKRREEEAARRKAEEERIAAEKQAEEAKRKAAEAEWADDEAEAAAARKEAEAKAAEAARAAEAVVPEAAPAVVIPKQTDGVKFEPDFEVEDIDALYRFSTALVKMEPKRSEILAYIKAHTDGEELPKIPGLRVFAKAKVSTR